MSIKLLIYNKIKKMYLVWNFFLLKQSIASNDIGNRQLWHNVLGTSSLPCSCLGSSLLLFVERHQIFRKGSLRDSHLAVPLYRSIHCESTDITWVWTRSSVFLFTEMGNTSRSKSIYSRFSTWFKFYTINIFFVINYARCGSMQLVN